MTAPPDVYHLGPSFRCGCKPLPVVDQPRLLPGAAGTDSTLRSVQMRQPRLVTWPPRHPPPPLPTLLPPAALPAAACLGASCTTTSAIASCTSSGSWAGCPSRTRAWCCCRWVAAAASVAAAPALQPSPAPHTNCRAPPAASCSCPTRPAAAPRLTSAAGRPGAAPVQHRQRASLPPRGAPTPARLGYHSPTSVHASVA